MNDFIEIRRAIDSVLKRLWLIILVAIGAAAAGYVASERLTPVYEASATMMVGQLTQATSLNKTDLLTNEVLAQTYADMALRQPILQGVTEALKLSGSWRDLKEHVHVKLVDGTHLIQIVAEASSPEQASIVADEMTHQLMIYSADSTPGGDTSEVQTLMSQQLTNLQTKIDLGRIRLEALEQTAVQSFESLSIQQVQELQIAITTLTDLINGWESEYTQVLLYLEGEKQSTPLAVIEAAQASPRPISPRTDLNAALAGIIGLLVALGLVLLVEFQDTTLKSTDEINQLLGLTALGTVNSIGGWREQNKLLIAQPPNIAAIETYRIIRSNIEFKMTDEPMKLLVVTSPSKGEGKSLMVANLGIIMAHAGYQTVIVDADLRRPVQHQLFQLANAKGLTEAIRSPALDLSIHVRNTIVPNLHILTSGQTPMNQAELLGSQGMRRVLTGLRQMADIIICDSPSALGITDANILANRADGVVLVIEANRTDREAAKEAIANLQQANATLLGAIFNRGARSRIFPIPRLPMRRKQYPATHLVTNNELSSKGAS